MCGPKFCSMRITQDIMKEFGDKKNSEDNEIQKELEKKSEEFKEAGGNIYVKQS